MLRNTASPRCSTTDAELLHRFLQRRDDAAFGRLVARHSEAVRRIAVRATGNPSAAEDVAQAAFIVLARRPRAAWLSARCRGSALPWLGRTTRYAASAWRRSESRRRRHESAAAVPERWDPSEPGQLTEEVTEVLARLPRGERRLITLRHLDEKPWPEVAALTGLTPEAARKATTRALTRLRERLGQRGVVVTPAALGIALSTLSRSSHAAVVIGSSTSAFVLARSVVSIMQIKAAGLAGSSVIALAIGLGVLSSGGGAAGVPASSGGAAMASAPQAAVDQRPATPSRELFESNQHQPSVTLADGSTIALLGVTNGRDGWWHADGSPVASMAAAMPPGMPLMTVVGNMELHDLVDFLLYVEDPAVRTGGALAGPLPALVGVLDRYGKPPPLLVRATDVQPGRQTWRIVVPVEPDTGSTELLVAISHGDPVLAGQCVRHGEAWQLEGVAADWVRVEQTQRYVIFRPVDGGEEAAITVVGVTGSGQLVQGVRTAEGLQFQKSALGPVTRFEVHRRPLQLVRLTEVAQRPDQLTEAGMKPFERAGRMMVEASTLLRDFTSDAGGLHTSLQVSSDGRSRGSAEARGGGNVTASIVDGEVWVHAGPRPGAPAAGSGGTGARGN